MASRIPPQKQSRQIVTRIWLLQY